MPPAQHSLPRVLTACALLVVMTGSASAQSPPDRAALDSLRDILPTLGDTPALDRLADWSGDPTTRLVRQGLVLLRQAELGSNREPYDQATRQFERALDARSDWPYPWYALGLTRLAMWSKGFVVKATPYHGQGISYRRAAMDAFARAIKGDSSFSPASAALGGLIVVMDHRPLEQDFATPLSRAAKTSGAAPSVPLALFRLEFGAGHYDRALQLLPEYLRRGGDSGVARLEQARTLEGLGRDTEAMGMYVEGLRLMGDAGRDQYRADLAWVGADWELAEYDSLPINQVAEWVTRFWNQRDALALRSPGERLAEHLRRWVFVHQNFLIYRPDDAPTHGEGQVDIDRQNLFTPYDEDVSVVMTNLALGTGGFAAYRRSQWEVDDRGVIYLRHGPPDARAISPSGPPNESWAYDFPDGRRVFHFMGSRALGTAAATTLTASLPPEPGMLDSRSGLDPRYSAMAADLQRRIAQARTERLRLQGGMMELVAQMNRGTANRKGAAGIVEAATLPHGEMRSPASALRPETVYRDIQRGRSAIAVGVTTDGFTQHFKDDLDAVVQVYGVGYGAGQTQRILAVFAVPGNRLSPQARPNGGPGVIYPVGLRLIAMDREQGIIRQMDTVRTFLARDTLKGGQHLTGLVELAVPPGRYQVRTLVTAPGVDAATGAGRDSVEIPSSPKVLLISDLILGRQQSGLTWAYGDEKIPLNPLNTYPKGGDAELFYELGGLTAGAVYRVSTSVRRSGRDPKAKPEVQSSFDLTASGDYQMVNRGLGLANLKPGAYLLEVTVSEVGSDREVTRRRALNILDK